MAFAHDRRRASATSVASSDAEQSGATGRGAAGYGPPTSFPPTKLTPENQVSDAQLDALVKKMQELSLFCLFLMGAAA